MLLSLNKPVTASSQLPDHPAANAVDENIKTWWSAATGNAKEWLQVDLGAQDKIEAVQSNFADQGSTTLGRLPAGDAYQYIIEASSDGSHWTTIVDQKNNQRDAPHDYEPLAAPATARYVRITNLHDPAGMLFSLSGFRVFGLAPGAAPAEVRASPRRAIRRTAAARRSLVAAGDRRGVLYRALRHQAGSAFFQLPDL